MKKEGRNKKIFILGLYLFVAIVGFADGRCHFIFGARGIVPVVCSTVICKSSKSFVHFVMRRDKENKI